MHPSTHHGPHHIFKSPSPADLVGVHVALSGLVGLWLRHGAQTLLRPQAPSDQECETPAKTTEGGGTLNLKPWGPCKVDFLFNP